VSEGEVLDAAERRARALVERDAAALLALHHPELRWTTHRGEVLDRESYVRGNTEGELRWLEQRLEDTAVVIEGETAVLTAVVVDEVERDGRHETFRLRLTQTWVRDGDGWVVLAGHAGPKLRT
jgi:ketosteroid isomerase-like protein